MRRESVRRDELAYRREPFVWPVDTPPAVVLSRVEARASQLRRRRQAALAVPLPLALIVALVLSMAPAVPGGQRVRTVPPAADGAVDPPAAATPARPTGAGSTADAATRPSQAEAVPTAARPPAGHEQSAPVSRPPGEVAPMPATGRVAFVRDARIWLVNADGSGERPLTAEGERWFELDWSRQGLLVAARHETVGPRSVHVFDIDRGRRWALPNSSDMMMPKWSPDGEWLAFGATHPEAKFNEFAAAWVVRRDGTGRRMVSRNAGMPSWLTPTQLVFQTPAGTEAVGVDGRGRRLLTSEWYQLTPAHDGSRMLAMRSEPEGWMLYDVQADFSHRRPVIRDHNMRHDWSYDGEWVAVERVTTTVRCPPVENFVCSNRMTNIWLVRRDGTGLRQLTTGVYDTELVFGPPAPA